MERHRLADGSVPGRWWSPVTPPPTKLGEDSAERIECHLCPRNCQLKEGDKGFCFVRENRGGEMVLSTYGRSTGFCIDPIEKKPLNHFFPGTPILSFGTAGCNLGCKFCQNWDISKSREVERLSHLAMPEAIAEAALKAGARSVAFTYNDPVIWAEYAIDTARACRQAGIKTVAVTAGYISEIARPAFFEFMDAANVDLKAFSEDFYYKVTSSHLQPVLDTLIYLKKETDVWFELTNLLIPQANDGEEELCRMSDWIVDNLGCDVPIHFTAFHPDFRMLDRPATPHETLIRAREIAQRAGIRYAYVGNVHDVERQSTYCPDCKKLVIQRDWHQLGVYHIREGKCGHCRYPIAGHFENVPGNWGRKRLPIAIQPLELKPQIKLEPNAMTATKTNLQPEHHLMLQATSATICSSVLRQPIQGAGSLPTLIEQKMVHGVFVTLKRNEHLRGCRGLLGRPMQLGEALRQAAKQTACDDARMPAISPVELPYLSVGITLLGPMQQVIVKGRQRISAVVPGVTGLRISNGAQVGLLLPDVATEMGWDAEQFLQAVCRKAGLPESAWYDEFSTLEIFHGEKIHGAIDPLHLQGKALASPRIIQPSEVQQLAILAAKNMIAFKTGATPSYVDPNLPDGTVEGIVLTVTGESAEGNASSTNPQRHWMKLSFRPGVPLQSTLFELCQAAATQFDSLGRLGRFRVDVTLLQDPAYHGNLESHDLSGVDPQHRGLLVSANSRNSLLWAPEFTLESICQRATSAIGIAPPMAAIHSLAVVSTLPQIQVAQAPAPQISDAERPAAIAGTFYPAADAERIAMVDKLVREARERSPINPTVKPLAIMVPHAALRFSGNVAASVWANIAIPSSLLLIGPKHTPQGVDWAVSPHRSWRITDSASLQADLELSRLLVENITGMQWDVAAHSREHSIEIELPFVHFLAPQTRIAAVVMQAAGWSTIARAAKQLAALIKDLEEPPLLVISSDMNHFSDDAETRRRDELALEAFESGDPERLLRTCQKHQISMCGQVPAALVLQTLLELGRPLEIKRTEYATSGDTSGDLSRVVGYAGAVITG